MPLNAKIQYIPNTVDTSQYTIQNILNTVVKVFKAFDK